MIKTKVDSTTLFTSDAWERAPRVDVKRIKIGG
jgi:hypothetical protein